MGGKMAWSLAAAQPDRVQALVLMAPDGFPETKDIGTKPYEVPAIMGVIQYFLPKYLVRKSIEPAFANSAALNEALVNRYFDMLRAPGVRGAILDRSNQTIYSDPVPRLKAIKAPTLLIWGEQDQMIPSSNAQSYAGVLLNSTTVLVPQLGHLLQEEQPEKGLAFVMEFLDQHLIKLLNN
jgi:pimeloyl-ACP methyl ester carboxylesterase